MIASPDSQHFGGSRRAEKSLKKASKFARLDGISGFGYEVQFEFMRQDYTLDEIRKRLSTAR